MSSGHGRGLQHAEERASEVALEAADCFAAGFAFGLSALDVGDRFRVVLAAADDDGVQGAIQQPPAAPIESPAGELARATRARRSTAQPPARGTHPEPAG